MYSVLEMGTGMQREMGWARPICSRLKHHLDVLCQGLAAETQQEVSRSILARLVFRIESTITAKKFTALGGLLLERCSSPPQSNCSAFLNIVCMV
jgi:hypothetical protein